MYSNPQAHEQWAKDNVILFAEDMAITVQFRGLAEMHHQFRCIGLVLDEIERLGLSISHTKTHAIVAMGGQAKSKALAESQRFTATGMQLMIPRKKEMYAVAIQSQVRYLGVIISFGKFEEFTLRHRMDIARTAFPRLSRWLTNRRLPVRIRLRMWQSCVFSAVTFGLLGTGCATSMLKTHEQTSIIMLRQIMGDHSPRTHHTHRVAFQSIQQIWPLAILQRAAERLTQQLAIRQLHITPNDILHRVDWSRLPALCALIDAPTHSGPLVQPGPDFLLEALPARYQCTIRAITTTHLSTLKRRYTIKHKLRQFRAHPLPMQPDPSGFPTCPICKYTFTTWRNYKTHVERRACEAPRNIGASLAQPRSRPSMSSTPSSIIQPADLDFLRSTPVGVAILEIVATRQRGNLYPLRDACALLSSRCVLCGQVIANRPQEMSRHLRMARQGCLQDVYPKAAQLFKVHGRGSPCGLCAKDYKHSHQCPAWTQLALLYLHDLPEEHQTDSLKQLALTCEVCGVKVADQPQMMHHLRQRKLVVSDCPSMVSRPAAIAWPISTR